VAPTASLKDILGYPAWTAGATVVALVTIGVMVYLFRRGLTRKDLGAEDARGVGRLP
jgi:hypothetical protein